MADWKKISYGDLMDDLSFAWRRTDAPLESRSDDGYWVHIPKGVFEEMETFGLSIPEPKLELRKQGCKPKEPEAIKPKRPRGRPRKDANQSVGLL